MLRLTEYKTLVFDCDGVILNSNQLKIQAYFDVATKFGANQQQAKALVDHHVALGGISRYPKFEFFLREIMKQPVTKEAIDSLLGAFTVEVKLLLMGCEIAPDLMTLRQMTPDAKWMVISGGDQAELREIFQQRKLTHVFDAGIFGSPDNKDQILAREIAHDYLVKPALFIGDSRYDYQASTKAGLDFVFLSDWTDVEDWQSFCAEQNIQVLNHLGNLLID